MTSSYRMIKESEIKTIIWYNDESQGMPVPIGIFPPSIPDSMIIDMIKVLNDNDVEGKYAVETEKYINSNCKTKISGRFSCFTFCRSKHITSRNFRTYI